LESAIVKELKPEFPPVAIVWSNTIPDDAIQFKNGKFGCILNLFAVASRRGKIAGGNRESITCNAGRAALGLGIDFDKTNEQLDRYAAIFSKGLKSVRNKEAYQKIMEDAPKRWHSLFEYGERRYCSYKLAKEWILHGLPRYDISYDYVLFKPLNLTNHDENIQAIVFPVNPIELAGLVTLAGSVMPDTDIVRVAQGPDCSRITAFPYAEAENDKPRAVLGMLGVDGREVMHRRFRNDTLTLTLPRPLFQRMELEANDCIFQTPSWIAIINQEGE